MLELALRLLKEPDGVAALYRHAGRFDGAGVFYGGDWAHPDRLQPDFVTQSLHTKGITLAVEVLSELRFLAILNGEAEHPDVSPEDARRFLEDAIGFNLDLLFPEASESTRITGAAAAGKLMEGVRRLFEFIVESLGTAGILGSIVDEAERVLRQRPILVQRVKMILGAAARTLASAEEPTEAHERAAVLIDGLLGPTELSRSSETAEAYGEALASLDADELSAEAGVMGDSMWATGLVCVPHAVLLRYVNEHHPEHLPRALRLDATGRAALHEHEDLTHALIDTAVHPATAQCIYGLASMLVAGLVFFPPVAPGLRRLLGMRIDDEVAEALRGLIERSEHTVPPDPHAILLSGVLSVLGQPLGVGQGDNPTCQSARAISLWAQADVGYLLEMVAQATRDNEVAMHFEGQTIISSDLPAGMAVDLHTELDPVSLVLVPHLDRVYAEMSRRVAGRGEDGHKWINPEFHGWWVYRGFAIALHVGTESVVRFPEFVRLFYASYHPDYRGEAELIYPQPVGVAATDYHGVFLGWHAVSIHRVGRDPAGEVRLYFYNPNNDGGQRWGQGIVTSTSGHGELAGESSLPFHEFAARLYIFHYNVREHGDPEEVPPEEVDRVAERARESWAAGFPWIETPGGG